jgi:hypothetical protein
MSSSTRKADEQPKKKQRTLMDMFCTVRSESQPSVDTGLSVNRTTTNTGNSDGDGKQSSRPTAAASTGSTVGTLDNSAADVVTVSESDMPSTVVTAASSSDQDGCDRHTTASADRLNRAESMSSCDITEFDIGDVDFSSTLSDSVKFKILTEKFVPDKAWKGPQRFIGKCKRRVPSSIFEESLSCLSYSVKKDGVFCAPCSVFAKTAELFVRQGHNDWSNIERHVQRHVKCKSHYDALQAASEFLKVCDNKQDSVQSQLSKAYSEKVRRNRSALISIVKTIILCGKQNIPLRGHTDDHSNFSALLNFRSECDEDLRTHFATCSENAKYVSHEIQNELIQICGGQILSSVLDACRKARFFSVIMDETTDISVREQVSLVLLYVDSDTKRRENFVGFQETFDTTGDTLYQLLCEKLVAFGLDKKNVVGLGFDGAANMAGKFKGVQARFSAHVPDAQYVHCRAHCLNLAIMRTCQQREVRNMYGTVSDTVTFIQSSAKRMHVFRENVESSDFGTNLKKFCATRWTCHEETLSSFLAHLPVVCETLQLLTEDSCAKTCSTATSLLNSIHQFQFLAGLR